MPLDKIVTFQELDAEICKLRELLQELGILIRPGSDIDSQIYAAFATLYYSLFSDERPSMNRANEIESGAALAGLGDLARKINRARTTGGFAQLRLHLAIMVNGAVRMNTPNLVTDEVANKNSELYVGCLALGAGFDVELEDPVRSAGGRNPDVILKYEEDEWAIAVKTSHSAVPQTIFDSIRKGASQVERSGRTGIVFVNVKNIIDHKALAEASPFPSINAAKAAVEGQIDTIIRKLHVSIVPADWEDAFAGKRARPLVVFMGQMTVSGELIAGLPLFVPVKVMQVLPVPPLALATDLTPGSLTGLDAAAFRLLVKLNDELQD